MTFWQLLFDILFVLFFVFLNAFFVAAEFALVKIRLTQIEPLVQKGNWRAKLAREIILRTNAYLSAAQLGITMTSLALGWLGEPLIAGALKPLIFSIGIERMDILHGVSFAVAFSMITAVHIVVGEQAPKVLAIQRPLPTMLNIAYPLRLFYLVFGPLINILNAASNGLLRLIGMKVTTVSELVHSEEELRLLLAHDTHVTTTSKNIALNAIDFRLKQARHAMLPRKEIVAVSLTAPLAASIEIIRSHKFSRFPVYRDSIDNIVGMVFTKDIFKQDKHHDPKFALASVLRDAVFLPETATLEKTLETMLQKRAHMVILADEYGGTAGLITLELVLEELVGNIQDEFDRETPEIVKVTEDEYVVDGSVTTNEIERLFGVELSPADIRSIGGFAIEQLGHIPAVGESFQVGRLTFLTEKVVELAVETMRVKRQPGPADEDEAKEESKNVRTNAASSESKKRSPRKRKLP
jgi:CBS domain containing-hemolysin-like protein